jgi:heme/copper-type cytochrome/quinol oxidase subunit 2
MIRQLAIGLLLFLSPFAIYWLFLWAARPAAGQDKITGWTPVAFGWLTITALLLLIAGFAAWATYGVAPPGATYVPAHMENGRFVPGTFK